MKRMLASCKGSVTGPLQTVQRQSLQTITYWHHQSSISSSLVYIVSGCAAKAKLHSEHIACGLSLILTLYCPICMLHWFHGALLIRIVASSAASVCQWRSHCGCPDTPKNSSWVGVWHPTISVYLVTCNRLSLTSACFSPQNAPKPFDGRALRSLRPLTWLHRVPPTRESKRTGGRGKEGGMDGHPSFWDMAAPCWLLYFLLFSVACKRCNVLICWQ